MSLSQFLERARSAQLDLKIERAKQDAAEARSSGIAIPPPAVSVGWMRENSGNSARGWEASQTVPFPTKLMSDRAARVSDAQSQREWTKAREKEILSFGKVLYLALWGSQQKLSLMEEK